MADLFPPQDYVSVKTIRTCQPQASNGGATSPSRGASKADGMHFTVISKLIRSFDVYAWMMFSKSTYVDDCAIVTSLVNSLQLHAFVEYETIELTEKAEIADHVCLRDFHKPKTGSVVAFKVNFRDYMDHPLVEMLTSIPDSKFHNMVLCHIWDVFGAYNSSNLQLANTSMEYNPLYDADNVMPSSVMLSFKTTWDGFSSILLLLH
ncbi:hypothetical protein Tco_0477284 [Tanacetum coccineum]